MVVTKYVTIAGHMATVKPVIRRQKKGPDGRVPIWFRILDGKRQLFVSTGLTTITSQWNSRTGRVRKSHPHADMVNRILAEREHEAKEEILRLQHSKKRATGKHLQEVLRYGGTDDLFAFARRHLEDLKTKGNVARGRRLRIMLEKLRAFHGEPLPFERITPAFLEEWQTHMITKEGNRQTTAGTNLSDLRALVRRAVKEDVITQDTNPFTRFSIDRGQANDRSRLSVDEIQRIQDLSLTKGSHLWHVRNYWLFAFFTAGMRFKDLALLTHASIVRDNDGVERLTYRMGKTGDRHTILLVPQAREILAHYRNGESDPQSFVFPILYGRDITTPEKLEKARGRANALVNKHLRQLASHAGIEKRLTTHVARHSFADMVRKKGENIYDISKSLAHKKSDTTAGYLARFDVGALDAMMTRVFDNGEWAK